MSTLLEAAPPTATATEAGPRLFRFSPEQYERMAQLEILPVDSRTELIDGVILMMSPMGVRHGAAITICEKKFWRLLPDEWHLRCQVTLDLGASLPDPDFQIVYGQPEDFLKRRTRGSDVALIVEISDSSVQQDRETKGKLYAAAGIPIYWLINLDENQIEVYTQPQPTGYAARRDYRGDEAVPVVLDGDTIGTLRARELLPAL